MYWRHCNASKHSGQLSIFNKPLHYSDPLRKTMDWKRPNSWIIEPCPSQFQLRFSLTGRRLVLFQHNLAIRLTTTDPTPTHPRGPVVCMSVFPSIYPSLHPLSVHLYSHLSHFASFSKKWFRDCKDCKYWFVKDGQTYIAFTSSRSYHGRNPNSNLSNTTQHIFFDLISLLLDWLIG